MRRLFAFAPAARAALRAALRPAGGCVVLVTCGRTEVYSAAPRERLEDAVLAAAGLPCPLAETPCPPPGARQNVTAETLSAPPGARQNVTAETLSAPPGARSAPSAGQGAPFAPAGGAFPFCFYEGAAAEEHLFALAAGLRSMLAGEDEILGQVRAAYEESRAAKDAAGLGAPFQAAIACGKRVRAETAISSLACSVATLAAAEVAAFGAERVFMIGATGKIGGAVLKNLLSKGLRVAATVRSHAYFAAAEGAEAVPYEERYARLDGADAVVCCTASPHAVLEADKVRRALRTPRPRLFIDLAVPPDIEEGVGALPLCRLVGIDGFAAAAAENNAKKAGDIAKAGEIVRECLRGFAASCAARRLLARPSALSPAEREALLRLRRADPAVFVRAVRSRLAEEGI